MPFPLYHRPGAVVFLDDDPDYLEMLADVMPANWHVRLMLRPVACIESLVGEIASLELDRWSQQEMVKRWREGNALIPQILAYWRTNGLERLCLARACVVDYSMPAMSGLKVLSEITGWPGSRILLTGRADEHLAVSAFNSGLIQQFIPKQSPDIRLRLTAAIENLLQKPDESLEQNWRATLSREQTSLLADPTICASLQKHARQHHWIEHVVIGEPFGILALDTTAKATWLQLEPANRLTELAEMAESQGWSFETVQQVRSGKKLIDLELQLALGTGEKPRLKDAFVIGPANRQLHAAVFDISAEFHPHPSNSYQNLIAGHSHRVVQP